jgi:hypothetical protein
MVTRADWQAYIDLAKSHDILQIAQDLGCRLKKAATAEFVGPCLIDGGADRFSINTRKQVFNCRGVDDGGDIIRMVCHVLGCSVGEACERITGRPRPDSSRDETMEERAARMRENAARMEVARIRQEQEREVERIKAKKDEQRISEIIDRAAPIEGTHGEAYLRIGRGLTPNKRLLVDLKYIDELDYWGLPDNGSGELRHLASVPAVIAIIRNFAGDVIGISQTYLDPKEPRKWRPTGSVRNSPKKIRGVKKGGMIHLGRITETLAIGEGWENPLAWHQLGGGLHIDNLSLGAAVDRGNLSGQSLGKTPHPKATDPEGARLRMPSGLPDLDAPGVIIPDGVKTIIIVADANSDAYATAAYYVTAVNRFQHHGLKVGIAWPPPGYDWNDILVREQGHEKAAVG